MSVSNPADLNERQVITINSTDQVSVMEYFKALQPFLRGTWSAKRGATVANKEGKSRPLFDIIVPSGQINGQAEVGRVVMVSKAKGGCAPFVLVEQLESAYTHTPEGVALTTWRGELVQH